MRYKNRYYIFKISNTTVLSKGARISSAPQQKSKAKSPLLSFHHPFDTQINDTVNNTVSRRSPKNKVFAGSGGLQYRVALVAGKHTKGMYTSNVEFRCQHCRNPSGDKRKRDVVTRWSLQSAIQMKEETKQNKTKNSCSMI